MQRWAGWLAASINGQTLRLAVREQLLLCAIGGALLLSSAAESASTSLAGVWSGDQHRLTIDSQGARLETDCAGGTILGSLRPDGDGRFVAAGTYEEYRPGPQRADVGAAAAPAPAPSVNYLGEVRQGVMTLLIQVPGSADRQLTLREGSHVKLRRCL